jgi:iron complex transport system ATP-binding protein
MRDSNILQIQGLSLSYPNKDILDSANLSMEGGQLVSLQGRNGAGKSTLLRSIAGLDKPSKGTVSINGQSILALTPLERSTRIGALWTDRVRIPGFTLRELILMGTFNGIHAQQHIDKEMVVENCMSALNISDLAESPLDQLSDGELQKGMIARALAQQPSFLLLDEPTTFLDYIAKDELMSTLKNLCRTSGIGILFSSHDLGIINTYADRKWELKDRQLLEIE